MKVPEIGPPVRQPAVESRNTRRDEPVRFVEVEGDDRYRTLDEDRLCLAQQLQAQGAGNRSSLLPFRCGKLLEQRLNTLRLSEPDDIGRACKCLDVGCGSDPAVVTRIA